MKSRKTVATARLIWGVAANIFFALGIGIGLTERLVSQASSQAKEKIGKLAYAFAMLKELGAKPHRFVLQRDEKIAHRRRGVALVVANAGEIGGGLKFAPDAKMDDGLLDICILHRFYLRDVLRLLWRSVTGKVRDDRAVSFSQAKRIELRSDPPLDVQIDGEVVDLKTPLVIEIAAGALSVRVPLEKEREIKNPRGRAAGYLNEEFNAVVKSRRAQVAADGGSDRRRFPAFSRTRQSTRRCHVAQRLR